MERRSRDEVDTRPDAALRIMEGNGFRVWVDVVCCQNETKVLILFHFRSGIDGVFIECAECEQLEAVNFNRCGCCVVAAGSGKTRGVSLKGLQGLFVVR